MDTKAAEWNKKQIRAGAWFLQSAEWGQFQTAIGNKAHFISGKGWSCMAIEKKNRLGKYLFAPYGPTLSDLSQLSACLSELVAQTKRMGLDWLRLEPLSPTGHSADIIKGLRAGGARPAPHNVEPALTRILDISMPTDDLLAKVSQSTRSLIRKNQRENTLTFKTSTNPVDMAEFAALLDTVAARKGINFFSRDYFIDQAKLLMPGGMMFLEQAYHGNQLVGGAVIHDYGRLGSYTYAASLPEARNLSVSALLLWHAIVKAQSRGINTVDLYGTAPDDALASHPWYGFSTYKKKFGGQVVQHAGTWDIATSRKYHLYRLAQTTRLASRRH